ncbi:MAG: glucuronate isomerase [Planctomycetaceae bacterium]|nr:glucuronate isomerase [Planctomycetaceae bacterium]
MTFISDNFLLQSEAAVRLYHEFAAAQPIIDYHCHLPVKEIAEDRRFENLTQIWLAGDHYKWRAMRAAGVSEEYITGSASDWEKFQAWAETVPKTLRNPLYHWTHLELKRPFGIADKLLSPSTAKSIWDECNAKLQTPEFSARGIMRQMNVKLVCTTDDPIDSLEYHQEIRRQTADGNRGAAGLRPPVDDGSFDIQVLPTFRPDKAMQCAEPTGTGQVTYRSVKNYYEYLERLADVARNPILSFDDLLDALNKRHDYFHENGCRLSDHGFGRLSYSMSDDISQVESIFLRLRDINVIKETEVNILQAAGLRDIAIMNYNKQWTMQLHIGAMRNNNIRFFHKLGPDTGFDSMIDGNIAESLSNFFAALDSTNKLPKTIVYNLNPAWNDMLATLIGNFQDGKTPGKMQFGSGWWFLDQKDGMENQLKCLSNHGLLSLFVGMLTDSRSFLSYTRHEYFRRILCNLLGEDMKTGLIPMDYEMVGKMVGNICYYNAKNYFGFEL